MTPVEKVNTQHFLLFCLQTDVHFQKESHAVVLCSQCFPLFYLPRTKTFLIYCSMFIATAQFNDYVFVFYNCQNYIMRFWRRKVLMCYLKLYKAVLINVNALQASSCDC